MVKLNRSTNCSVGTSTSSSKVLYNNPSISNSHVFFATKANSWTYNTVYALDGDGNISWEWTPYNNTWISSQISVGYGKVIVGCGYGYYCFEEDSGKLLWILADNKPSQGSPFAAMDSDGSAYLTSYYNTKFSVPSLVKVVVDTGVVQWTLPIFDGRVLYSPTIHNGRLYVLVATQHELCTVLAVDSKVGIVKEKYSIDGVWCGSFALKDNMLVFSNYTHIAAFDMKSSNTKKQAKWITSCYQCNGASIIPTQKELVIVQRGDLLMTTFELSDGAHRWTTELKPVGNGDGGVSAWDPRRGKIIINTYHGLAALNPADGAELLIRSDCRGITPVSVDGNGVVYYGCAGTSFFDISYIYFYSVYRPFS